MARLDEWERLQYRMEEEGIAYCFRYYSDWTAIDDERFHELKNKLIDAIVEMEEYVQQQIDDWDDGEEWQTIPPQN